MGKYSSYLVLYNVYFCNMVIYISYFIESSKKTWAKCEEPRICQTEKWRWGFFEELVKPATSQISYKVNFCFSKHIISIIYNILLTPGVKVSSSKKSLRICRFFTFSSKTRSISPSTIISTYGSIRLHRFRFSFAHAPPLSWDVLLTHLCLLPSTIYFPKMEIRKVRK